MMQRTHDGPPFPTGTNETTTSLAAGHLAAAYAEPTDLAECARCYATVPDRLDLHWDDELHAEVCPDCCPECKENDR